MDLKEILGEELYTQVAGKIGDKKLILNDGNYIPKGKFDEVNNTKNDFKTQLQERDKQLEELKKQAGGNDELAKQVTALQEANQKATEEYEKRLATQKLDFSVENQIIKAKGRNAKAVKALLDFEKVKVDGDKIYGLEEQLAELKKSDAYLFADEKQPTPGANPPPGAQKTTQQEYTELKKQVQQNPNDQSLRHKLFMLKATLK